MREEHHISSPCPVNQEEVLNLPINSHGDEFNQQTCADIMTTSLKYNQLWDGSITLLEIESVLARIITLRTRTKVIMTNGLENHEDN